MRNSNQSKVELKPKRVFSIQIRKQVVKDIEAGKCSVLQVSRELSVSSQSIYRWIYTYSRYLSKNKVMVVEDESEAYRTQELLKEKQKLLAELGQKQLEIDILKKMIELAEAEYGVDLKKISGTKLSPGSKRKETRKKGRK